MQSLLFLIALLVSLGSASSPLTMQYHYPRAISNTSSISLLPTGSTSHNCSWSWASWTKYFYMTSANITTTYTYYNMTASTTVGCDNITRIVGDLTTTATGTNVSSGMTYYSPTSNPHPAPTCIPPPEDCSDFAFEISNPCQRPTTSVIESCGRCSIYGGTVDLLYFPPTATASSTLCPNITAMSGTTCPLGPTTATNNATNPYENRGCYYATSANTSTVNSGPYTVSDGYTFYQNRAYISMETAYAKDGCGFVGKQHTGTILEVKSDEVYSVGGYHHEFADYGFSFNFDDLKNPPSYAYYMPCADGGGLICSYGGTRYRTSTDFINGQYIDFGNWGPESQQWIWPEAYAPYLLLPTQIRNLDPAWSTCDLNLGGLYDPPKALQQTNMVTPTAPTPDGGYTSTAQPGSSPSTHGPGPTQDPATTRTTAQPDHDPSATSGDNGVPQPTQPADPSTQDEPAPASPTSNNHQGDGGNHASGDGAGHDADGQEPATTTPDIGGVIASAAQYTESPDSDNGGAAASAVQTPSTTKQNIGGFIASALGMSRDPATSDPADPTTQAQSHDSNTDGAISGAGQARPVKAVFTADGKTHTVAPVEAASGVYVVDGSHTMTAGDAPMIMDGVTMSAASGGQIVAGSESFTITAHQANAAFSGTDGSTIDIQTVSSGVYEADGTTLSVGGSAAVVNGVTMSAMTTGVVGVGSVGPRTTASGSPQLSGSGSTGAVPPAQTDNTGAVSDAFDTTVYIACVLGALAIYG